MKKNLKTEQISTRLLYGLVGLSAVVFLLFYLVGYNMPYVFDPEYNAPLFTDVLIGFMYFMLAAAVAVAVYALVKERKRRTRQHVENGIPAAKIERGTLVLLVCLLAVSFLLGSSSPVTVNGKVFDSVFWLKATDMLIYTSLALIAAAVVAVAFAVAGNRIRRNK